jgi:hypothetical protein
MAASFDPQLQFRLQTFVAGPATPIHSYKPIKPLTSLCPVSVAGPWLQATTANSRATSAKNRNFDVAVLASRCACYAEYVCHWQNRFYRFV